MAGLDELKRRLQPIFFDADGNVVPPPAAEDSSDGCEVTSLLFIPFQAFEIYDYAQFVPEKRFLILLEIPALVGLPAWQLYLSVLLTACRTAQM